MRLFRLVPFGVLVLAAPAAAAPPEPYGLRERDARPDPLLRSIRDRRYGSDHAGMDSRWVTFGDIEADDEPELLTMLVGSSRGRFTALRLTAVETRVRIRRIYVVFGNGRRQRIDLDRRLDPGQVSPPLELEHRGNGRFIERVLVDAVTDQRGRNDGDILVAGERAGSRGRFSRYDEFDGKRGWSPGRYSDRPWEERYDARRGPWERYEEPPGGYAGERDRYDGPADDANRGGYDGDAPERYSDSDEGRFGAERDAYGGPPDGDGPPADRFSWRDEERAAVPPPPVASPERPERGDRRAMLEPPAAAPPVRAEPPASGTAVGERLLGFVNREFHRTADMSANELRETYADQVDYYGEKSKPVEGVIADKKNYAQRWPSRSFVVQKGTFKVISRGQDDLYEVVYKYDFDVSGGGKKSRGIGESTLLVRDLGESFVILSENGKILKRL